MVNLIFVIADKERKKKKTVYTYPIHESQKNLECLW